MMAVKLKQDVVCKPEGADSYHLWFTLHKPGSPIEFDIVPGQPTTLFHDVLKITQNVSVFWRVIRSYEEVSGDDEPYVYPPEFRGKDRHVGVLLCEGRHTTKNELEITFERRVAYLTQEEGRRLFNWSADMFSGGLVMLVLEKYLVLGRDCWNLRLYSNCSNPRVEKWLSSSSSSSSSSSLGNVPPEFKLDMTSYGGSWKQVGGADNFDKFLSLLKTSWALRKIILMISLKQQIECEPVVGEPGNHKLHFTLYRPGPPIVFTITPGVHTVANHELLRIDMHSSATWRVIRDFEDPVESSVKGGFQWPAEFCGKDGRNVAILYCEGRDIENKELVCIFERRVAYLTQEEGRRLFNWSADMFSGARVMIMHEQYLPLGVDGWNIRKFACTD